MALAVTQQLVTLHPANAKKSQLADAKSPLAVVNQLQVLKKDLTVDAKSQCVGASLLLKVVKPDATQLHRKTVADFSQSCSQ